MDDCKYMPAVENMVAETCSNFYLYFLANMGYVLNTEVVLNFIIMVLIKFQLHWTCITGVMK